MARYPGPGALYLRWSPPDCSLIARCWLLVGQSSVSLRSVFGRPRAASGESAGPRGPPRGIGSRRSGGESGVRLRVALEFDVKVKVKVKVELELDFEFASEGPTFGSDEPGLSVQDLERATLCS